MQLLAPSEAIANQAPAHLGHNAFDADPALREALEREGGGWARERLREAGALVASEEADAHRRRAQRNIPRLLTHDRHGNRVDRVEYDPSFHWLLEQMVSRGIHSAPWTDPRPGAHVARAAGFMLFNELDTGPTCPMAMNYGAVPTMAQSPGLAAEWTRRITSTEYATYAQAGMVMTEKQGGSDLRANTTRAEHAGGEHYELTGHKWFCTHPVFAFFFTLAQTAEGPTCFVAERPHPGFRLQRLKDKLGGRCLASSEVELDRLPARLLGEPGRGVRAMAVQINYTRLDTMLGVTGMLRRAVAEAVHHARHRSASGRRLAEQPAMHGVLADLALESEAATATALRVARSYDGDAELPFRRLATAVSKYWICKRGPAAAAEALECLGGNGYVEEAPLAQVYRDIQIGSVWEGSGNVAALDVLRAIGREPAALDAYLAECELARGADPWLDAHLDALAISAAAEWGARRYVEDLALALQASLLVRHAPHAVADAFCASRLGRRAGRAAGTLHPGADTAAIAARALEA